jgi:putative transposase
MGKEIDIRPGSLVGFEDECYVITNVIDFESVLTKNADTGEVRRLFIRELTQPPIKDACEIKGNHRQDLEVLEDDDWKEANRRFAIIRPLVNKPGRTTQMIKDIAKASGVHFTTFYRWLRKYEEYGVISALVSKEKEGGRGKSRISKKANEMIKSIVKKYCEARKRKSLWQMCKDVIDDCKKAKIRPPHPNTIRKWINVYWDKFKLDTSEDEKEKRRKNKAIKGSFPGADWPLAVVQIDHSPMDIVIVDDTDREPIGRPWITMAIDVFSRMVAAFYISLDPPGTISVGLCIVRAIVPKDKWLAKLNITTPWPVWGKSAKYHVDNAAEFHGKAFEMACKDNQIDIDWRPIETPHYGGHIERLLGTFSKEIHILPGTTFSNIKERGKYDSDKEAVFTLSEIEEWLTVHIVQDYHQRPHKGLNDNIPIKKFEEGIFGTKSKPGKGLPSRIIDEEKLFIDFLPFDNRTVQTYGIVWDKVHYYSSALDPWINAKDPDGKSKRKFIVRRDPRDISVIYFYDPELKEYFPIPYRNTSRPAISLWEWRAAEKRLREEGVKDIDEDLIFEAHERKRKIEDDAIKKTKGMRRARQRRKEHEKAAEQLAGTRGKTKVQVEPEPMPEMPEKDIAPFDDIEESD